MNLQELGAPGIIAVILLTFAVIGFVKGLIRTILAVACLVIAGYAAFWAHEYIQELTTPWSGKPGPWLVGSLAATVGLIAFVICRYLLKFLIDPFDRSSAGRRFGFGIPAALLTLGLGFAFLWSTLTAIRYAGSIAELRGTQKLILKEKKADWKTHGTPLLMKARQALDRRPLGKWHRSTDPFYTPGKVTLCEILLMYHDAATRKKLLADPAFNRFLNNPDFLELAYDTTIKDDAAAGRLRAIYNADQVNKALDNPDFAERVEKSDPDAILR